jgi:transcriptional regulator with XRE-family HTH domain
MKRPAPAQVAPDFPSRLDAVLRLLGYKRNVFARRIDMDASNLTNWLLKGLVPSTQAFDKIEALLGKPAANYLRGVTDIPPAIVLRTSEELRRERV